MRIELVFDGEMDVRKVDFTTALEDGSVIAKVKLSCLVNHETCSELFGIQFADLAFATDSDGKFICEKVKPLIKMDPHQVQYGGFCPGTTKPTIESFEPVEETKDHDCGVKVIMTVPTMFKADEDEKVVFMVRKIGHGVRVRIEPAQMNLPLDEDEGKEHGQTNMSISVDGKDFVDVGSVEDFSKASKAIVAKARKKRKGRTEK